MRVGIDRLIGETEDSPSGGREGAKATFSIERSGVAAMALGMIDKALELSVAYAKERVQFGQPIGDFQLIQDKLARMEVARLNVENLVFRYIETSRDGVPLTLAEASAMKLYSARAAMEVALEAIQIFGGNGYMSEFQASRSPATPRCSRSTPVPTNCRSRTSPRTCYAAEMHTSPLTSTGVEVVRWVICSPMLPGPRCRRRLRAR